MNRRNAFAAICLTVLLPSFNMAAGELRGGAAVADITPQRLPVSMTGGFQDRKALQVHDRLHARAIVLDNGVTRIAIVICDSCLITRDIYDRSKSAASIATGIPVNRILTAATHTHSAPTAVPLAQCSPDPEYVEHLTKQITQSIVTADSRLQPVQIGSGFIDVPEEVSNRRWFVKPQAMQPNPLGASNDQVRTNPPRGTGLLIRSAGPVDPAVTFLSVQSMAQGKSYEPVALLANYGLHYVGGIPAGHLSADYFGEFARRMARELNAHESFVGMMSNGASGDVNNYRFPAARPRSAPFERIQAVATVIAERVAQAQSKVEFTRHVRLGMTERELELRIRKPESAEIERARNLLAAAADPDRLNMNEVYAQETLRLAEGPDTVELKLQTIAIGDLALVAVPCEVFAEIGLEIRRKSPFRLTCVIGLANGYNGYLPSPGQHALGGYETWRSGWSYLETEASTKIIKSVIAQLKELED